MEFHHIKEMESLKTEIVVFSEILEHQQSSAAESLDQCSDSLS